MRDTDDLLDQLHATMGKMELALDAIAEAICWTDREGRVEWCNASFEALAGRPRIALLGRQLLELVPLERDGRPVPWVDHPVSHAFARGPRAGGTYDSRTHDRSRVVEVSAAMFGASASNTVVVVIRDVTDQARADAARRSALASAEQANRAKSDFLARMSHELRTPLNAIIGFSDLMALRQPAADGEVSVPFEWVRHINEGGENLLGLVNDLLDLSKIEAGRLQLDLEALDLASSVARCVAELRPVAERKKLHMEQRIPAGLTVRADRSGLHQIVYNLLSNAIKFTPETGRVELSASAEGRHVRLSVADSGVGIAPEDQALVFEEFRQVGDPRLAHQGSGLGLALTRRLAEAHHGRVEVHSEPGVGSTFTVVLQAVPPGVVGRAAAPAEGPPVERSDAAILVVDDDPGAAELLRAYLEPEGYRVLIAEDGESALAAARRERPAAILLDVLLPGMYGWDVLRRLKDDPELRDVPVIVVSVIDGREGGLALGAADYVTKPVDRTVLLASVERVAPRPAQG